MNYKNEEDIAMDDIPDLEDVENPSPSKVIQISFEEGAQEPSINYTADLNLSEVIGALEISKEMLISAKVLDKLHKRRLMQAYNDV